MLNIEFDYPVIITLIGALLIGLSSGILSCYATLKQQSLLGDAIAHAALPGICIAFLLTFSKSPIILLIGAMGAGFIGTLFILAITHKSIIKEDTAMGVILSVFFGFGILLLTVIQKIPNARQAGLDNYLFGNASSMLIADIKIMSICCVIILITTFLFWKEFKLIIFDYSFSQSIGRPSLVLESILISLIVLTIIIGLQSVGVILTSALIIAPGTAARQWTNQLSKMIIISILICILSTTSGVLLSSSLNNLPTGPTIVICLSILTMISLLFSPRGMIIQKIKKELNKQHIKRESILKNLYLLAKTHDDMTHAHNINTLIILGGKPSLSLLNKLKDDQLIYTKNNTHWGLTELGVKRAIQLTQGIH